MKKLIPLLMAVFALTACEKQADLNELDGRYVVYTNYAPETDFQALKSYYLPDSILIIGDSEQPTYDSGKQAKEILQAWADNMESRGFVRTESKKEADTGLQVSYVESCYHFTAMGGWPGWGWDYPWYWGLGYWGNWGGWYYPFVLHYSYHTGSFLAELVNLTAPQGDDQKLPVVWNVFLTGALSGSTAVDTRLAIDGVNQAFAQSAYLTHTPQ